MCKSSYEKRPNSIKYDRLHRISYDEYEDKYKEPSCQWSLAFFAETVNHLITSDMTLSEEVMNNLVDIVVNNDTLYEMYTLLRKRVLQASEISLTNLGIANRNGEPNLVVIDIGASSKLIDYIKNIKK